MEYLNYGKNGSSIAYSSPRWGEAMYVRYKEMPDDLDYVIVVGGHNDGFKLDSIGGIDVFKERLAMLCEGLLKSIPQLRFFSLPDGTVKTLREVMLRKWWML